MDLMIKTFMDLSAIPALTELIDDTRAAWLWSADGSRILWANAAGAQFFAVRDVAGFARLSGLSKSPARPHIARIATSGSTDRMTIDRLRFYRGLRVMLLTCQCQRLQLADGHDAALIVCGDKGLALLGPAAPAFVNLLDTAGHSAAVVSDSGDVVSPTGQFGSALADARMEADTPKILLSSGARHDGHILRLANGDRLVVIDDAILADGSVDDSRDRETAAMAEPAPRSEPGDTGQASPNSSHGWMRADELEDLADSKDASAGEIASESAEPDAPDAPEPDASEPGVPKSGAPQTDAVEPRTSAETEETVDLHAEANHEPPAETETAMSQDTVSPEPDSPSDIATDCPAADTPEAAADNTDPETDAPPAATTFTFQPRRRPVRFAWKMDIDQRITFLSDEFTDTLGPSAANIVGLTWAEIAVNFGLDDKGSIARALDRRDTWSGKTVFWPVTGKALRVPVDMAALPAFDRNRVFEGYRGFGVCRTADAVSDPTGTVVAGAAPTDEAGAPVEAEPVLAPQAAETGTGSVNAEPGLAVAADDDTQREPDTSDVAPADAEPALDAPVAVEDAQADAGSDADAVAVAADAADADGTEYTDTAVAPDLPPAAVASPAPASETVLGATAAALIGSLSAKSGLSVGEPDQPTGPPEAETVTEDTGATDYRPDEQPVLGADDASASEGTVATDPGPPESDTETEDISADAAAANTTDEDPDGSDEAEPTDTAAAPDKSGDAPAAEAGSVGPILTGVNGPAPLRPAEIETAVKNLSKEYGQRRQMLEQGSTGSIRTSGDLFEQMASNTAPDETPAPDASSDDIAALAMDAGASAPAPEHADDAAAGTAAQDLAGGESESADDERDFFAETAAHLEADRLTRPGPEQSEPLAASTSAHLSLVRQDGADDEPGDRDPGNIVRLTDHKPQLVPVDTSALSRPERAVFRKIAEALGARFEGDMSAFDAPGNDDFEEDLLPEIPVRETGPIDPRLLDRLPIGIAIAQDRDVLYANDTLLDLLGYLNLKALTEAGGLEAVFVEEDEDDWPDADGMDGTVDGPLKVRLAGGGLRAVDARMHSVPWNGGKGLMISFTERTAAQKKAPAITVAADAGTELSAAQDLIAEMDTILETATDGVLVLDRNGTITKINRSAEALFSANRSDMIGAPLTEFLAPESHRAAVDYLDGLARNGVASVLNDGREVLGQVPGGGLIPLFMTIGRISSRGEPKFCAVLRDITHWKTAEEELTEAKRQAENASSQKSDFLAKISHEIRTPLNAIIGFSEVMMEERFGAIGNDRYKDYLKDIRTSGSHIMSLINDLLDLSKIEAGKLDLRFAAVSANEVINECVALMQPQANRERVIIRASLPDSVPSVVADLRSMRQIILNLLSNAIKFNKSGGQVIVSTSMEDNGEVVLRVRDTGTGMSAKELAAAMEPFRQVHTSRLGGGTGLGLPLTKALVEANRAAFRIDSTPQQGTLVEISFPSQRVLSE